MYSIKQIKNRLKKVKLDGRKINKVGKEIFEKCPNNSKALDRLVATAVRENTIVTKPMPMKASAANPSPVDKELATALKDFNPKKKVVAKKDAVKPVAKKVAPVKTVVKKTTTVKPSVAKPIVKKIAVKKTTTVKPSVAKPIVKKAVVKKESIIKTMNGKLKDIDDILNPIDTSAAADAFMEEIDANAAIAKAKKEDEYYDYLIYGLKAIGLGLIGYAGYAIGSSNNRIELLD